MKKILVLAIIALIALSGCLESQKLFDDTNNELKNENFCKEWCDKTNDLHPFITVECEDGECLCRCKAYFW